MLKKTSDYRQQRKIIFQLRCTWLRNCDPHLRFVRINKKSGSLDCDSFEAVHRSRKHDSFPFDSRMTQYAQTLHLAAQELPSALTWIASCFFTRKKHAKDWRSGSLPFARHWSLSPRETQDDHFSFTIWVCLCWLVSSYATNSRMAARSNLAAPRDYWSHSIFFQGSMSFRRGADRCTTLERKPAATSCSRGNANVMDQAKPTSTTARYGMFFARTVQGVSRYALSKVRKLTPPFSIQTCYRF